MALDNLHVLAETVIGIDAYTTTTRARVQIGDPASQWFKPMVLVRVRPSHARDPMFVEWFRGSLEPWHRRHLPNNPELFDLVDGPELVAMFEDDRGISLEVICDSLTPTAVLPRSIAARIIDAVYTGLRARHELGLAHGAVSLDSISICHHGSVTIGIGRPWDPGARPRDDLRHAERLRRDLLERSSAIATKLTLDELVEQFR